MASPTEIRKGRVLNYNSTPHLVLDAQHRTQGRQAGFIQVTMRNLNNGASTTQKIRSTESVDFCHTETRKLEYSYVDDQGHHFLDPETFEDTVLSSDMIKAARDYLVENNLYDILLVDGKAMQVQLPAAVEMKVVESPEAVKGDTASNVQKPATMETGLVVQVPLFIKEGEVLKIKTEDGSYLSRA